MPPSALFTKPWRRSCSITWLRRLERKSAQAGAEVLEAHAGYAASQYTDTALLNAAGLYVAEAAGWAALGGGLAAAGGVVGGGGGGAGPAPSKGVPFQGSSTITPRGPGGVGAGGGTQVIVNIDGVISPDTMEIIAPSIADAVAGAVQSGSSPAFSGMMNGWRPNVTRGS